MFHPFSTRDRVFGCGFAQSKSGVKVSQGRKSSAPASVEFHWAIALQKRTGTFSGP
jgi:hypothetical protein